MPPSLYQLLQPVNILLVDDEPANLLALEAVLDQLGQTLICASSGEEALRKTADSDFAVILLDVRMPTMSGFETARQIRSNARFSNTPILFLTAAPNDPAFPVEKAYELGAVDYLIKPLVPAVLRAKVAFFVDLYRKSADLARIQRERLRESRARFALLLESCAEGVYGTDPDGICTFMNASGAEMFGYHPDELIGRALHDLIHDRQPDGMPYPPSQCRICRPARAGIRVRSGDEVFWRKDGTPVSVSCSVSPMIFDGRNVGAVVVCTDITVRKRTENALRKLATDLSEADRRKTEFLATLAHELRNPLAPMLSGLEVMRLANDDPETVGKVRDMMQRQLAHMVHLVNDLLDVARITGGKVELRKTRVEVKSVVESAVETSRPLIAASGHTLTLHLPEAPLLLDADPIRIAQVLSNLLNNAAKYTPNGGRIELAAWRDGGDAVISVTDTGIGIPAASLPAVFEMFTQVGSNMGRAQGGLGIGLTLVRRLVELHGGSVAVSSSGIGKGSAFVVRLPLAALEHAAPAMHAACAERAVAKSLRVLIVDDNRDAAEGLSDLLELCEHITRVANDGYQALQIAQEFLPEVVFLDIGMPGKNGYEVARELRTMPGMKNAVLVALTGWGGEDDRMRSREAGFNYHLIKPVGFVEVNGLLSKLARSAEQPP